MSYRYDNVEVLRVVDGDTFDALVDVGFGMHYKGRFRLYGVDTPEIGGHASCEAEKKHGEQARIFTDALLFCKDFSIVTYKTGSFGRWLCDVIFADGTSLKQRLVESDMVKRDDYEQTGLF